MWGLRHGLGWDSNIRNRLLVKNHLLESFWWNNNFWLKNAFFRTVRTVCGGIFYEYKCIQIFTNASNIVQIKRKLHKFVYTCTKFCNKTPANRTSYQFFCLIKNKLHSTRVTFSRPGWTTLSTVCHRQRQLKIIKNSRKDETLKWQLHIRMRRTNERLHIAACILNWVFIVGDCLKGNPLAWNSVQQCHQISPVKLWFENMA